MCWKQLHSLENEEAKLGVYVQRWFIVYLHKLNFIEVQINFSELEVK